MSYILLHLGINYLIMKKYSLGEFEEIVMLTIGLLYGNAYGVSIKNEIESRLPRRVSVGALQTALKRLEQKGYLVSKDGESNANRAGRPKKLYEITMLGRNALTYVRETRDELWRAIPDIALNQQTTEE